MDNFISKQLKSGSVFVLLATVTIVTEALTLPAAPLTTTKTVQPNLMLLIDSSGSMLHIVEDSVEGSTTQYDASVDYYNCSSSYTLSTNKLVTVKIRKSDGRVWIEHDNDEYRFGSGSSDKACFSDTGNYKARLYANEDHDDDDYYAPSGYGNGYFSGNYLNWYFSNSTRTGYDKFGAGARNKPVTQTRSEVAQVASKSLVSGIENVRVGLAKYSQWDGAYLLNNIDNVNDSTHKASLLANIETIAGADKMFTPLGEAIQGVANYFTLGETKNLILHPDSNNPSTASASNIFYSDTLDSSSVTLPSTSTGVITNWCQASFMLVMTDGLPTRDENFSSHIKDYYNSSDDYFSDDVIAAMYEMDLRPSLNESEEIETKNNVTSYVVGFAAELAENQLMQDMAAASETDLLTATNTAELNAAFESITNNILAKVAAGSGASFNTSTLSEDSKVYAATFNTDKWSGSLKAFDLSDTGEISTTEEWDAAAQLDAMTYTDRVIYTFNDDSKEGVVFAEGNLSGTQLNDLQKGPEGNSGVANLINYIKGDTSKEGSSTEDYRARNSRLGDIVNSTVVYVGAPELNWPDYDVDSRFGANGNGKSYSEFKSGSAASRTPMLYVGANDGMLHGFNADENSSAVGEEEVAFIPATIASIEDNEGLHYLAMSDYAHKFYVDSTPSVSDVYVNGGWSTVLVGGLRSGGKGLFALDVTDPTDFTATNTKADSFVLWEFNSSNDDDFGYSYSTPTIAMMPNGKWAAIVGNGYNSKNGGAHLFIIYLDGGNNGNWSLGTDYIKLSTGVGTDASPNGLSTPLAVDVDGDSVVDRIYAGDLQGNMWAFDVSSTSSLSWEVAYGTSNTPKPLFSAKDSSGKAQPITTKPIAARNENAVTTTSPSSNEPNILIFFGTGQYIEEADKSSTDVMSYYGVWDDNSGNKLRADLTERKLITSGDLRAISGSYIDWTSTDGWYFDFVDRSSLSGTISEIGERVISGALISNDVLVFTTAIPSVQNADVCVSNSESWIMAVDFNTGKAPERFSVFDSNGDGVIDEKDTTAAFDTNNDGVIDSEDTVAYGGKKSGGSMSVSDTNMLKKTLYLSDVDGNVTDEEVYTGGGTKVGRLSWEELLNP